MQGVSVLDFTWFGVGPIATKYLADNGANVVKIESIARPDGLRLSGPWKDARPEINSSQFFGSYNSSKKSVMLDMNRPEARAIVRRLVPHFDVVANSFTPGIMPKWGLGYDDLRQIRQDVIVLSTCMQGQTGPHAQYRGFGQLMASLSGFYYLSGYSAQEISPPYGAYTDFVVPRMAAFALLAALDYRRRTGRGQHLDISQYEAAIHFIAPAVVDYASSGTVMHAEGNYSNRYAPHGAYRGADDGDEERWITIAVADDRQWLDLMQVLGGSPADPRFATMVRRLELPEDLDEYVQSLVAGRNVGELTAALQAAGVAAYPVQTCLDLHSDENLAANEFWQWLDQRDAGPMPYDGLSYRLERTGSHQSAAPSIGQDTDQVLGELLGMTSDDTGPLRDSGVIG
jgi:benzylsuccinate CoA-transferase BbsF subunit